MNSSLLLRALGAMALALSVTFAYADGSGDPTAVEDDDGKYFDAEGNPTYQIAEDGTVDWYTYSGFRRYHSECHVCHGPAGEGSTYAPSLIDSLKTMDYATFLEIVVNGRQNLSAGKENVMPALGTNRNVMCYLDDIFVYLRGRSNGVVGWNRPEKRADKPESFSEAETACLGS